ncbi:MAG: hypothetical protein WA705_13925 [Candidatus Ozemobacteraceae bacterium]
MIAITNLKFTNNAGTLLNQIPANNANNTPGYQPYPFFMCVTDSSGNTATFTLNTCLNVRDNIAPTMWATIRDLKNNTPINFPQYSPANATQALSFYDQTSRPAQTAQSIISWIPNTTTGELGQGGDFMGWPLPTSKLLTILSGDIVYNVNDANLKTQLQNSIPPGFLEDNVEFQVGINCSDNAGIATTRLGISYVNPSGGYRDLDYRNRFAYAERRVPWSARAIPVWSPRPHGYLRQCYLMDLQGSQRRNPPMDDE